VQPAGGLDRDPAGGEIGRECLQQGFGAAPRLGERADHRADEIDHRSLVAKKDAIDQQLVGEHDRIW
jgi:hypothetical protein